MSAPAAPVLPPSVEPCGHFPHGDSIPLLDQFVDAAHDCAQGELDAVEEGSCGHGEVAPAAPAAPLSARFMGPVPGVVVRIGAYRLAEPGFVDPVAGAQDALALPPDAQMASEVAPVQPFQKKLLSLPLGVEPLVVLIRSQGLSRQAVGVSVLLRRAGLPGALGSFSGEYSGGSGGNRYGWRKTADMARRAASMSSGCPSSSRNRSRVVVRSGSRLGTKPHWTASRSPRFFSRCEYRVPSLRGAPVLR